MRRALFWRGRWAPFHPLALSVLLLAPAQAVGDEIDRARMLGQWGNAAYERSDWETARALFHSAREIYPAPTLGLREARCLVQLGRMVEASRVYERVIAAHAMRADPDGDAGVYEQAIRDARTELAALAPRIPRVTMALAGPATHAALTLDGVPIPRTAIGVEQDTDPGLHVIGGTIDGHAVQPVDFTMTERERRTVAVTTPSKAAGAVRFAGLASIVLGSAAAGTGVGLGVAAGLKHEDASRTGSARDQNAFDALAVAATIAAATGAIAIVTGGLLVLRAGAMSAAVEVPLP